ncbi:hypothetical protein BHF71_03280 [Vulcanibacillus modesticaldus]|uniref:Pilus assembly protein PilM n=1 Tax=Vulcanibacillus modesticaldus TaxID=337097 RepID=A0A1D2YSR5_9BACI|nr:pilus assembly protein PilM [Vulcanibacillus modesticaldus]OEF98057.1 hypothetical protein BHF71_03280 [Vulcanibacillus modesticaldus]
MTFFSKKLRQLAIVFDDYTIRFVEVTTKNDDIIAIHHVSTVENNVVENGILDKEKWKDLLLEQLESNNIKAKTVRIVIPSSIVIIRHQTMPDIPVKDLKQIVQHELGYSIHLPFNNPIFDLVKVKSDLPIFNEVGEQAIQVVLVAAPGSFIFPLVDVLYENKMKPKVIDIPALSLYRLFSHLYPYQSDDALLLVNVTKHGVDAHILDKGILAFTRHIPMEVSNSENYQPFISDFAYEIERAINFYQYTLNNRDKKINSCWITSEIDFPEDFYRLLKERLDISVNPLVYKNSELSQQGDEYKGYEVGIGLFLRKAVVENGN